MLKMLLVCALALSMGFMTSGCVVVTGSTVEGPSSIKVKVAVARFAMSADHLIQPGDYSIEDRTLNICPSNAVRHFDQLTGKKTKKAIKEGHILTLQDIK